MIHSFDGKTPRIAESAFISDTAYIIGDVEIGENSGVFPGAVIRGDFGKITIGNNTMIEDNTVIHTGFSGAVIGDHCTVGHGVVLHCVKVGNYCLIGNNSTVLENARLGNFCLIAAGALVEHGKEIPDCSMVTGVPGVIRKVSEARMEKLKRGNPWYAELIKKYKQQPELNDRG